MTGRPIVVMIELGIREEAVPEFLAELGTLLPRIAAEPACLSIEGCADPADPGTFLVLERWTGRQEFEEFDRGCEYLRAYLERTEPLRSRPRRRRIWEGIDPLLR